jgi:hypothetical protein
VSLTSRHVDIQRYEDGNEVLWAENAQHSGEEKLARLHAPESTLEESQISTESAESALRLQALCSSGIDGCAE